MEVLAAMVPDMEARKKLLMQAVSIVGAGDPLSANEGNRLARLSQVLGLPTGKPAFSAIAATGKTLTHAEA